MVTKVSDLTTFSAAGCAGVSCFPVKMNISCSRRCETVGQLVAEDTAAAAWSATANSGTGNSIVFKFQRQPASLAPAPRPSYSCLPSLNYWLVPCP